MASLRKQSVDISLVSYMFDILYLRSLLYVLFHFDLNHELLRLCISPGKGFRHQQFRKYDKNVLLLTLVSSVRCQKLDQLK